MAVRGFFPGSAVTRKAPRPLVPKCGACGLKNQCTSPQMPPTGAGGRRALIVAEAPGEEEDKRGTQLVGASGKLLRSTLAGLGVDLDKDCWKTNAIICRPPENRAPTEAEIDYCLPNLLNAIRQYDPNVIIPLGYAAIRAVVGSVWREDPGPVEQWAGWQIPSMAPNAWICPTWHPSHILRNDKPGRPNITKMFWEQHLAAAFGLEARPWEGHDPPKFDQRVEVILDTAEAAARIDLMTNAGGDLFAFDYETNMLKPDGEDAAIVSCSICRDGRETIAFLFAGEVKSALGFFLRSPWRKVASNLKFEDRWTRQVYGHGVRGWYWDTMIGAHVLDNRRGITSIKFQSYVRLGMPVYDDHIKPFLKAKGANRVNQILREVDVRDLLIYNGLDSLLELLVARQQIQELGYEG